MKKILLALMVLFLSAGAEAASVIPNSTSEIPTIPNPSGMIPSTSGVIPNTSTLATQGIADSLGYGFDGVNILSFQPQAPADSTGLNSERHADDFCDGTPNCLNMVPICEEKIKNAGTVPVTISKYTQGDCMDRASKFAMGSWNDYFTQARKQYVDKDYVIHYYLEPSNITYDGVSKPGSKTSGYYSIYFMAISVASTFLTNKLIEADVIKRTELIK